MSIHYTIGQRIIYTNSGVRQEGVIRSILTTDSVIGLGNGANEIRVLHLAPSLNEPVFAVWYPGCPGTVTLAEPLPPPTPRSYYPSLLAHRP